MKLSTRSRYGTRALVDIALNSSGKPVQLKDIAKRQEISTLYIEHMIMPLIAAGIVRSTRGAGGGVSLARPPEDIKLSEVISILEGSVALVECVDDPNYCPRNDFCVTIEVWRELKAAMNKVLEGKTVADLVERQKKKNAEQPAAAMYSI